MGYYLLREGGGEDMSSILVRSCERYHAAVFVE
jgi:hypothetical protein